MLLDSERRRFWHPFLELVYPPRCALCGQSGVGIICDVCRRSLPRIEPPICQRCGRSCYWAVDACRACANRKLFFAKARSFGRYEGNLREAIHRLKYHHFKLLGLALADLMAAQIEDAFFEVDVLSYVPLTRIKAVFRGYNQAEILARRLASQKQKPCRRLLKKTRSTKDQNTLSMRERRRNLHGVFHAIPNVTITNQIVLLVDDVFTTGSTLSACSRVLMKAGAAEVRAVTVARCAPWL